MTQPPLAAQAPSREELFELYKIAIEEYRFQVNLNWNRTQYYLVLNVGILGVATGVLQLAKSGIGYLVAVIYFTGMICAGLAFAAANVQQGYYHQARNHKAAIETALQLASLSISTTPGMGSTIRRLGKVTTFNNVTLTVLATANLVGVIASCIRAA